MVTIRLLVIFSKFLLCHEHGAVHVPLPGCRFLSQFPVRAFNMFQELPVHEKDTMDSYIFGLHQSHSKFEERPCEMNQVVDLPPLGICNFELTIFMVLAVFVNGVPEPTRLLKHQKCGVPAGLYIMEGEKPRPS